MSGLDLSGERKAKQAFDSWMAAGGWQIQDMTQPKTEKYNFPVILEAAKKLGASEDSAEYFKTILYGYANSIELPHDGEGSRGKLTIWFDYKYKATIKLGMGIKKEDYDKYADYNKPWFYLFILVGDTNKRYIHQVRAPKDALYEVVQYRGVDHYLIPEEDYWEPVEPKFPISLPSFEGFSVRESIAMFYALDNWACLGFAGQFKDITQADLQKADRILQSKDARFGIRFRKFRQLEPEKTEML